MRVLITTFGTRGDIQPFVALAQGLAAAGHSVAIAAPEGFRHFIEGYNISLIAFENSLLELTYAALEHASSLRDGIRIGRQMRPAIRRMMDEELAAARSFEPELLIYHPKCLGSLSVAELLQIPAVLALPIPFYTPTKAFAVPFMPVFSLGAWANRVSYLINRLSSLMFATTINDFRRKSLGMAPISRFANPLLRDSGQPVPILYPYSRHVLPVPSDFPQHVHVTGYWFLERQAAWQASAELSQFLQAGAAPIYLGFGSMRGQHQAERSAVIQAALQQLGLRGILASGWGGLEKQSASSSVFIVDEAPHDWLLPQVAAVVHHGGSGTVAAAARAGKPQVICPFLGDQPFWGQVIARRGVGAAPINQKRLTTERLVAALRTVLEQPSIQTRANELGQHIRSEDGVAQAINILESIYATA